MIGGAIRLTASGIIAGTQSGGLLGFYVASTNAGTLTLWDNTAASGNQLSGTITPAVGWHKFPARFNKGCFAQIGGTALDVTFFVRP